jgi:hypothetical protein
MNDLVPSLFVLSFFLAYAAVFILLLQWMVCGWLRGRRRKRAGRHSQAAAVLTPFQSPFGSNPLPRTVNFPAPLPAQGQPPSPAVP